MRWVLLSLFWLQTGWLGCGGEVQQSEAVGIAFEVDFLDVYGPIDVRLTSGRDVQEIRIDRDPSQKPCEAPAAWVEGAQVELKALSQNRFAWENSISVRGDCVVVRLTVDSMISGVYFASVGGSMKRCLPFEAWVEEPYLEERWLAGVLAESWDEEPAFTGATFQEGILRGFRWARDGNVVAIGGGFGEASFGVDLRSSVVDCARLRGAVFFVPEAFRADHFSSG